MQTWMEICCTHFQFFYQNIKTQRVTQDFCTVLYICEDAQNPSSSREMSLRLWLTAEQSSCSSADIAFVKWWLPWSDRSNGLIGPLSGMRRRMMKGRGRRNVEGKRAGGIRPCGSSASVKSSTHQILNSVKDVKHWHQSGGRLTSHLQCLMPVSVLPYSSWGILSGAHIREIHST